MTAPVSGDPLHEIRAERQSLGLCLCAGCVLQHLARHQDEERMIQALRLSLAIHLAKNWSA